MTNDPPRDSASATEASSLRTLFPWSFGAPQGDQLKRFLTDGLVVFDTNALFDAYRLNPHGRSEFLRTLSLLGDHLWVPHRVGEEFLKNRLTVINECAGAVTKTTNDIGTSFNKIKSAIEDFGGRRSLKKEQIDELVKILNETRQKISTKIGESYQFDLKAADCSSEDPILSELEKLLAGRVGPPTKDIQKAREEAAYRYERRIPPGYGDASKPAEQAIGDYVLWVQLLREAKRVPRPVLFVTNEKKKAEDWVIQQPGGRSPLPRPELSAELWEHARVPFHIVDVRSFLELANQFINAQVSDETIEQAWTIDQARATSTELDEQETLSPDPNSEYEALVQQSERLLGRLSRVQKILNEHEAQLADAHEGSKLAYRISGAIERYRRIQAKSTKQLHVLHKRISVLEDDYWAESINSRTDEQESFDP
ncbi:PIN-like domain-containing protein [Actinomadura sp. WMMA1423]|uniref:PIN-like domain-containing protein n=1 Tax=Actinomadura sp. WMMA1423 TaxID=2591108 RepID=UPI0011478FBF|nr:PIN-like domain-containing protein [Actinomadura sp. WMMA1423]